MNVLSPAGALGSLGHPRLHLRLTASTNDHARALAISGAPHGTLVTASEQTAGRGRQGRRWSAPPDSSLLMSLVLRCPPPLLPLIAAVAVCDVAGKQAQIKWPNDIVVESPAPERGLAKLAGILAEGRPQDGWAVLGIGLNVAVQLEDLPAELRPTAATLGQPRKAIEPLLAQLLTALGRRLSEPTAQILDAWRARDVLRGQDVTWAKGSGRAAGIDGTGRLLVKLPDGGHIMLDAGEVHLKLAH